MAITITSSQLNLNSVGLDRVPSIYLIGIIVKFQEVSIYILPLYIPSRTSVIDFEYLFEIIELLDVLIIGDFNISDYSNCLTNFKRK